MCFIYKEERDMVNYYYFSTLRKKSLRIRTLWKFWRPSEEKTIGFIKRTSTCFCDTEISFYLHYVESAFFSQEVQK